MAEEAAAAEDQNAGGGGDDGGSIDPPVKCPECEEGLPAWMATFSDLVTLLLTFFVLLLSFAKTETAKYEAALGSIRNAFGGNVLKHGEVIQRGKSPDDSPTMIESQFPIRPFPIDFLTMEGILDKREINRESDESLQKMKSDLMKFDLSENVDVYEVAEGIKVRVKDKIYFQDGSYEDVEKISAEIYRKVVSLLRERDWIVFVEGHASKGEIGRTQDLDAFALSALRAQEVARTIMKQGVRAERVSTVFYGDSRPNKIQNVSGKERERLDRRVEFLIRKRDLRSSGHKVDSR